MNRRTLPIARSGTGHVARLIGSCRLWTSFSLATTAYMALGLESFAAAADPAGPELGKAYSAEIAPLMTRYCGECHSEERMEAEIDLVAFRQFADVEAQPNVWLKVGEMLETGQMPPPKSKQPTDAEHLRLRTWIRSFLKDAARKNAGDPGPVVLRRLSNAEYTYVLRDLTGIASLAPAREFPVDGASGEGFTNAGNALVMSPALLAKYLDAGKDVAAHAMLLPDGIRFSPTTTRRDWTEELLAEIRGLYAIYSDAHGGTQVNLQGVIFDTNGGGRLPLEKYFLATLEEREALSKGQKTIDKVAHERSLSPKYLGGLWKLLASPQKDKNALASLLIDSLRERWRTAKPDDALALTGEVARWQTALWQFTSVGHIGKAGGPKAWLEPVNPIAARQEIRLKLPATDAKELVLYLAAADAGDGNEHDDVLWERPRFVAPGRPDLLLRDLRAVTHELVHKRERIFASSAMCLAAASEASAAKESLPVEALARKYGVETDSLAAWLDYLGIGTGGPVKIGNPITQKMEKAEGYDFIQGWTGPDALSVVANSSDQHVRIPGNMPPHSIGVHPTPTLQVAVGWLSPAAATLRIEGLVQHAHPECGNGVVWSLELRRGNARQRLATGTSHGPNKVPVGPLESIAVQKGDLISLIIGPRDGNHSCDLTNIDLTLKGGEREWNLSREISPQILAGNPHADSFGTADVWHFYSEPSAGSGAQVIPAGSLLAKWQASPSAQEKERLAAELQKLLQQGSGALPKDSPDALLYQQLTSLGGPLLSAALRAVSADANGASKSAGASSFGLPPETFGKHRDGTPIESASLSVHAPHVLEIRLPADLVAGAEFVTAGTLDPRTGTEGSVQLQVSTTKPEHTAGLLPTAVAQTNANLPWTSNSRGVSHATPIVTAEGSAARKRIEASFAEFREWFPAALCYTKIVPVDEVVTLTLFYREDDQLRRLMLDDDQTARLNRLWDEMHFVSQDALTLVDAFEQLWQYATQDADPKVFEPLRQPILDRAAAFRKQMAAAEPKQLDAVIALAAQVFRRPLAAAEAKALRSLYQTFREEELPHDEAVRLLLARLFVSPEFLYRIERPSETSTAAAPASTESASGATRLPPPLKISDWELATRLSFFLWSTLPDEELRAAATQGNLHEPKVLLSETQRLLKDPRVRRLATEFASQWAHIYEFDTHDEKSEAVFPTFNALRSAMYEESLLFFTDLFQRDGSILELLDADHTFLNEDLAKHYGIPGVSGPEWRRVDGIKGHARGGILGMATTLAKQSGASRTSPILRGNWVSEVLLGEKLPKPPKGVPLLPDAVPEGLTERQLIEQHSALPGCAKCHVRIDPLGFSLEEYDAIGRLRGNAPGLPKLDTKGKVPDGAEIDGMGGLRNYLLTTRRNDFVRQFCRKLLGYSLGRAVQLSDEPLLDDIQTKLKAGGYRISVAIEAIVQSPQFQTIRAPEGTAHVSQSNRKEERP